MAKGLGNHRDKNKKEQNPLARAYKIPLACEAFVFAQTHH